MKMTPEQQEEDSKMHSRIFVQTNIEDIERCIANLEEQFAQNPTPPNCRVTGDGETDVRKSILNVMKLQVWALKKKVGQ